jgi:ferredoxin
MKDALRELPKTLQASGGIFPRRRVNIVVDRAACTGCALCVARAPGVMALDESQKAYAVLPRQEWSPADGAFAHCCPVNAIHAQPVILPTPADSVAIPA